MNTLWGSFEVSNVRLAKMQLKQYIGSNVEDDIQNFDSYADRFQRQLAMYYMTFHGSQVLNNYLINFVFRFKLINCVL